MCVKTEVAQILGALSGTNNVAKKMGIVTHALVLASGATGAHASFRLKQHNKPVQAAAPSRVVPLPAPEQAALLKILKTELNRHFTGKNGYRLRLTWPCGRQFVVQ